MESIALCSAGEIAKKEKWSMKLLLYNIYIPTYKSYVMTDFFAEITEGIDRYDWRISDPPLNYHPLLTRLAQKEDKKAVSSRDSFTLGLEYTYATIETLTEI